nr:MAG TPA: hypothetical protein [Caudoviricetes sp.]
MTHGLIQHQLQHEIGAPPFSYTVKQICHKTQ